MLVDSVTDYAIFMLDVDGRVATWNRGAERIKGYMADEIVGQHFSKFYVEEDIAAGRPERLLQTVRDFGRVEDEGWRVRKDGSRFWALVVITALRDENGDLRGFGKVTRDLTHRRRVEDELRQAEERFHHLVDAVTDYAIFLLDASGNVSTWNEGASRIKGYTAREIVGQHFSVFYPPEDRAAGLPEQVLETVRREGRFASEGYRVRKDGTRFWASVVITPLRDSDGQVTAFAKVTRDLTEPRKAAEELRRSEERFRLLIAGVVDYAIYMLDPDGLVATWNQGAERMKGYTADEIIGQHFSRFFLEEDVRDGKPEREIAMALEHGRFEEERYRVRKDGARFWANVVLTPMRSSSGELIGFAKVTRDLTARRQAEEVERNLVREQAARAAVENSQRLLRASEEEAKQAVRRAEDAVRRAEEASRVKDEFLATVSHELRTPLNAILGWASLLRARSVDPAVGKGIEVIQRNAQAQARIIEDILDVSRIVTGKLRLDLKPSDLVMLVTEAIEVVRPSALAKGIQVELTTPSAPAILLADPERLRQVIWNLLSNAVKFTDSGGQVTVWIDQQGSNFRVFVRDTGRGILPEFLPYVFERFKQADGSTTRRFGGLGLGLAIVRHIVELHGGDVQAESEGVGKGALFRVTLPVRALAHAVIDVEQTPAPPSSIPSQSPYPQLVGLRILVVDDEQDARELLELVLSSVGAVVETAESASTGIEALRRFRAQVLISDVGMPIEDGYSLIQRVRALPFAEGGGIPSIALTAYTGAQDRTKALAAGFTTHIGKPVDPSDLLAAVANLAAFVRR